MKAPFFWAQPAKPLFLLPQKVLRVSHCDIVRLWPQHHLTVGQAARQAKKLGICLARRESCAPPRCPVGCSPCPQTWKIDVLSLENHRTHLNVQAMVDCQRVNQEERIPIVPQICVQSLLGWSNPDVTGWK